MTAFTTSKIMRLVDNSACTVRRSRKVSASTVHAFADIHHPLHCSSTLGDRPTHAAHRAGGGSQVLPGSGSESDIRHLQFEIAVRVGIASPDPTRAAVPRRPPPPPHAQQKSAEEEVRKQFMMSCRQRRSTGLQRWQVLMKMAARIDLQTRPLEMS